MAINIDGVTVDERSFIQVLDDLRATTGQLIDDRKELIDGRVFGRPSAYSDLVAAVPGTKSGGGEFTSTPARVKSLVWADAFELRRYIDAGVRRLVGTGLEGATTPELLRAFVSRAFRPQDVEALADAEAQISEWCASITALLEPPVVKEITANCPVDSCGARYAYRQSGDEMVRQAALTIVSGVGAKCGACGTSWSPDLYLHLLRLLGGDVPAGVVA